MTEVRQSWELKCWKLLRNRLTQRFAKRKYARFQHTTWLPHFLAIRVYVPSFLAAQVEIRAISSKNRPSFSLCLSSHWFERSSDGELTDPLTEPYAIAARLAEMDARINTRVGVLLRRVREAGEGTGDAWERRPARHGEGDVVSAEEMSEHRGGRAAEHTVR
jgi:hypothetical protein